MSEDTSNSIAPLPYECNYEGGRDIVGPYTSVCPRPSCHWYGKRAAVVYDANGIPVCSVPSIHHWDKDRKTAKDIAEAIATALNAVGFGYKVKKGQA